MLLPSPRHRREDLELWGAMEAADRLHYLNADVAAKEARAAQSIAAFAAAGPCYAAVSWGKDSMVIALLVARSGLNLTLANIAQHGVGYDPHIPDVRDAFLSRFACPYLEVCVPLTSIADDGGHSPALDRGIRILSGRLGTRRYIGGIRAQESGVRRISLRSRGTRSANTCQPLGWWSTADVFACLAHHDLPVHPNYAMLGGGRWDRAQIRVSTIGGPKGDQFGRREWEAEYYRDVLGRCRGSDGLDFTHDHAANPRLARHQC